jgi:Flp pilus assembly protein TadG
MVISSRTHRRSGVAAVELAVLLPFLMFVFLVAVDFTRVLYYTITIENCLHNGAIFSGQIFDNQNQQWIGNNQYWQGPNGQLLSAASAAADVDGANLNPALSSANVSTSSGTDSSGNPVVNVTITYTFYTLIPYPGIPSPLTISRTMQARVAPATPS